MDTETFGHRMDTVDHPRVGFRVFDHQFDTVDRHRRSIETFCHWSDTVHCQDGVLILFVTGWTQLIVRKGYVDVWSLDRCSRSSARCSETFGH